MNLNENSTSLFKGYDHMGLDRALNALSSSDEEEHKQFGVPLTIEESPTHSDSEGFIHPADHSLVKGESSTKNSSKNVINPPSKSRKVFRSTKNKITT